MTLLECVDALEAEKILDEIHEGVCGTHANGHMMARRCHKCKIYEDKTHAPVSPLHVLTAP